MGKKKEGGQPGNKNAEKWTEAAALEISEGLIEWLYAVDEDGNDKGNIFYKEFLLEKGLYKDVIDYLSGKYKSFLEHIKKAKEIQEMKLLKYGVADRLQPTMTIFVLKNKHGFMDRQDITTKGEPVKAVIKFTD